MTKTFGLVGLTAAVLLVSAPGGGPRTHRSPPSRRHAWGGIIRAHLLAHAEIITKGVQALRQRQAAEEAARDAQALQKHRA
jgi:hypothetical protein